MNVSRLICAARYIAAAALSVGLWGYSAGNLPGAAAPDEATPPDFITVVHAAQCAKPPF